MLNILKNTINRVFASGVDSDASAFITATGLSGTTQKSAITTLVKDLKSSGLWSKMKAVYPMVTDNYNIYSYSQDFSNAFWIKNNSSITTNTIAAPDGTLTASTFSDNSTNGLHYISTSNNSYGQNGNNTVSIYAKANTLNWFVIYIFDGSGVYSTYFNLSSGTVGTNAAGNTASIINAGNGWYRCIVTRNFNGTAASANAGFITANADGVNSYSGTGKSVYIWGSQFEFGSTATTYQSVLGNQQALIASQMKYNLKDARDLDAAFRLTWSGGWTYSATGATPNGTNAYADTKLVPSTAIASVNSNSLGYYSGSNLSETSSDPVNMGSTISGTQAINILKSNTNISSRLNGDILTYATAIMKGFFVATRPSSTVANLFFNGSKVSTITPNGTLPIYSVLIGTTAFGSSPYVQGYVKNDFRFAFIADGLTDNDSLLLNQIVEKYQVALSRGVQAAQSFYYNSAYSNEANTYLYSTQITGTTQVSAINTLINGLKANNLWSKMKAVYPFVTDKWNMLSYTEDFSNAAWSKGGGTTVTANSTTAPDGTLTADTIVLPNTGTISQSLVSSSNNAHTLSIYLKASSNTTIKLGFVSPGSVVVCNVTTEWQRFTYTYYFSGTTYPQLYNDTGSTVTLYAWGAQAELGTSASTYQPVLATNNYSSNVAAQMKFNLVNPQDSDAAFRLAFSGGWTYSTNGAQPNGTNGYADTKLVPSTALSSQNSQHYSLYSLTNIAEAKYGFGSDDVRMALKWSDNILYAKLGTSEYGYGVNSSSLGMHIMSRIDTSNVPLYIRNSKINVASATTSLSALNILLGARKLSASIDSYGSRQTAFASIGDGLTDAEAAMLYQIVQQFQTDLSRQV